MLYGGLSNGVLQYTQTISGIYGLYHMV